MTLSVTCGFTYFFRRAGQPSYHIDRPKYEKPKILNNLSIPSLNYLPPACSAIIHRDGQVVL